MTGREKRSISKEVLCVMTEPLPKTLSTCVQRK